MTELRRHRILGLVVLGTGLLAVAALFVLWRAVEREEYARTDERLTAELAGAVRAVDELGRAARARAVRLAARPDVQEALSDRDAEALRSIAASSPRVAYEIGGRVVAGTPAGPLAVPAAVVSGQQEVGRVLVDVPVRAVEARTALAAGDRLVAGEVDASERSPATLSIDGSRYRGVSTAAGAARLTALAPHGPLADAIGERRRRIFVAVLVSFASVLLLTLLATRLARPRRDRRAGPPPGAGEQPARDTVALVGNALAAGHDVDALLPVILESAVTISGAAGARLIADGNELARAGAIDSGADPLAIPLVAGSTGDGLLVLYPPSGGQLDPDGVQHAEWLAGRASIALQNAHLHRVARQLATTDELTQLANRRQFDEALAAEVVRAERFRDPVAVVVADLDNFKEVNDRFGHDVGDLVLRAFAAAIRVNVRDVDLPARYGGEEFTVLLPATDAEGGRQLAERLRRAAEELVVDSGGGGTVAVRSSFGVASFPAEPSAAALLRAADRALYRAKAAGKNTVFVAERRAATAQ